MVKFPSMCRHTDSFWYRRMKPILGLGVGVGVGEGEEEVAVVASAAEPVRVECGEGEMDLKEGGERWRQSKGRLVGGQEQRLAATWAGHSHSTPSM